jgi:HAD superfamily hydrolase (TIGR01490 family)
VSKPGAAFFDLDKTVIAKVSTLALGRPFRAGGLITRRDATRAACAQAMFALAGADAHQIDRIRDRITAISTGWDVARVQQIVNAALPKVLRPLIYPEAAALIAEHRAAGREIVLVSTSGEEVVGPIGAMVGADHVIATKMVVEGGKYTGEIAFYAYAEAKATAMAALAAERGYDLADCYAYSDSFTDVPMLSAVGHPTAVNPDRALRNFAATQGWPILAFRPVPRPHPLGRLAVIARSRSTRASAAVGISAAGIAWGPRVDAVDSGPPRPTE